MLKRCEIGKTIASVTDVAKAVSLSRSQFYELMRRGIFPSPSRTPTTNRPYYDEAQQAQCVLVRTSNCGVNGEPVLFYSRRNGRAHHTGNGSQNTRHKNVASDSMIVELRHGLEQLGLRVSGERVREALHASYPNGHGDVDGSTVLMTIFRHLKRADDA